MVNCWIPQLINYRIGGSYGQLNPNPCITKLNNSDGNPVSLTQVQQPLYACIYSASNAAARRTPSEITSHDTLPLQMSKVCRGMALHSAYTMP